MTFHGPILKNLKEKKKLIENYYVKISSYVGKNPFQKAPTPSFRRILEKHSKELEK